MLTLSDTRGLYLRVKCKWFVLRVMTASSLYWFFSNLFPIQEIFSQCCPTCIKLLSQSESIKYFIWRKLTRLAYSMFLYQPSTIHGKLPIIKPSLIQHHYLQIIQLPLILNVNSALYYNVQQQNKLINVKQWL